MLHCLALIIRAADVKGQEGFTGRHSLVVAIAAKDSFDESDWRAAGIHPTKYIAVIMTHWLYKKLKNSNQTAFELKPPGTHFSIMASQAASTKLIPRR
jgi:hypothetical protein